MNSAHVIGNLYGASVKVDRPVGDLKRPIVLAVACHNLNQFITEFIQLLYTQGKYFYSGEMTLSDFIELVTK